MDFFVCLVGSEMGHSSSRANFLPSRKSWLAQGSSGRLVTLLDLPGKCFLQVNEALGLLSGGNQRASAVPFKEIILGLKRLPYLLLGLANTSFQVKKSASVNIIVMEFF